MNIHSCSPYCLEYNCAVEQRDSLRDEVFTLRLEVERLKSLLTDWQEFAKDVGAGDPCGQDWLDGLRGRTKAALEQKA